MNKEQNTFRNHLAQTTPFPFGIKVKYAKGSYIYDENDQAYLDFISGIGVSSLGHGNEAVNSAIKNQVDKHLHVMVYGEFEQEAQNQLAEELMLVLPPELDAFYFVNSGTEANEAALKLAKRATGRTELIAFKGSYHGSTHGSLSVSYNEIKKIPFRPLLPDVSFIQLNFWDDLEKITKKTAAVILETIQGDAGVRIPNELYLKALSKKCKETGTLLILDEIQCGMGRTGKMWAFEHYGIQPDILTSGKALGAGMPIGALICSRQLMAKFSYNPMLGHITTFGGHPVVCAAAAAGLKFTRENHLLESVQSKAELIHQLLVHEKIKEVRHKGLMFAIELESEEKVKEIVLKSLENGLILFWFLSTPNAFRLAPPLTISEEEIRKACQIILDLL
ncbi:MAG: aspartate aminotransferase family protein [Bacteroidetes bacterium]|nr:MAG: aspartate aminotransferase family protein [Bacteroidota bacterium]MBL1144676.1 aspartate aminotransferase family protein [Bacteroidota bacterium]MCB0802331.1 aspartate aminotransferase family protein [Flavobacteriales bacterium]NOG57470.1 aspartate aminotransferase family protein [Bacteroidota bacterium]